ncbi:MAG TPA: DUF4271 domain-containing protein [Bacteroidales bacterium]|nr:DUF4271 domain-containing protein [Bacteroidales bacterium]
MIVFTSEKVQDTLKISQPSSKVFTGKAGDAISIKSSAMAAEDTSEGSSADSSLVCRRNDLENISFYDKSSFLHRLSVPLSDPSVIELSSRAKDIRAGKYQVLLTRLKAGENPPAERLNHDFILLVLVGVVLLMAAIRSSIKNFQPVTRFFLFRGLNDQASNDTGVLFHWQTTLLNLMSFFIISLFAYQVSAIEGIVPAGWNGIVFWLVSLGIIITALTFRHIVCVVTGNLSGKSDIFNEYLIGIYQSYHFTAMILFVLVALASFTVLISPKTFVIAGICGIAAMYIIRVTRLLLIFINRNISVFYLILYLCALEFLPVAVIIRFFSAR